MLKPVKCTSIILHNKNHFNNKKINSKSQHKRNRVEGNHFFIFFFHFNLMHCVIKAFESEIKLSTHQY